MSNERFRLPFAVFLILQKEGKIWLQRRAHTGYRDGHYDVISGHVDGGETARAAVIREAKEEAGITVLSEDLTLIHVRHNKDSTTGDEYINFFFVAEQWEGEPENVEKDKSDASSWFALDQLPEPVVPHLFWALDAMKDGSVYSDFEMTR